MNAIERIMKTLNHEEPDRVPSYEIVIDNYDVFAIILGKNIFMKV